MIDEPDTTPIHKQYAQRFSADLETNRKEQEVLSAQITELEARLKQLKADESWLCGMQGALPAPASDTAAAGQEAPQPVQSPAGTPAAGVVPQPRRAKKSTGAARTRKTTQARKASGTPAASGAKTKTVARKPAAPAKAAKPAAEKSAGTDTVKGEPPLRELVLALLVGAAEPRMVGEVTTELAQAHPGRSASTQVVRNTLEALAKKSLVEKERKQGSVMYSAPRPAVSEPVSEAAPTTGTADEKEPVQV
ncbi:hypothetical protein ACLF6K_39715 (plasmid) [Streptomyces xanthophaeus]|uniref:hypothetical protein n=1 Tax=Streptomyces xanthophaeus TaxID=67385 RepID=UPI0039900CF3